MHRVPSKPNIIEYSIGSSTSQDKGKDPADFVEATGEAECGKTGSCSNDKMLQRTSIHTHKNNRTSVVPRRLNS